MKRMFTTAALALTLAAGTTALAGPEHAHDTKEKAKTKADAARPTLADLLPAPKTPDLWIGSDAPSLQIAKFVKGDSVDQLADGQVYVVEFWATWCGPCIAAFPHLSEMQESYGDKVQFMGVNVWEQETGADRIEMVTDFVADQGERMEYTVAVEVDGKMSETWLRPADQNGIPAAFIVDQKGKIAWIGHPMNMDEPLEKVVSGEFDSQAAAKESMESILISEGFTKFQQIARSGGDFQLMHDLSMALINDHLGDEPHGLNAIAWILLTSEAENMPARELKVARKAAKLACDATEWKDWSILDTYALACMKTGDAKEAVKWQQKAIDLAPAEEADAMKNLNTRLAEYTEAAEG